MTVPLTYHIESGGVLSGEFTLPGDKSISHRSALLAALATGTSEITHFLTAADTCATLSILRQLGVSVEGPSADGRVVITGVGLHGLSPPTQPLDCGNAGTALRLLLGILAAQPFTSTLTGDHSLCQRPMARVLTPLALMGAQLQATTSQTPPISITPSVTGLHGIDYVVPMASAQVQSCLLFAGLYATGNTSIHVPQIVRDHSVHLFRAFGAKITQHGLSVAIAPVAQLSAQAVTVVSDISSAAFFMVGASIASGSAITLLNVGINPTRTGVLTILRQMGADIRVVNEKTCAGERVADLHIRSADLHGVTITPELVALAIDEIPILLLAASCAIGKTRLTGASELRVKESDRLAAMAAGLQTLGVPVVLTADGMEIDGIGNTLFQGGEINSYGDHRIAMTFAIAGLRARSTISVRQCDNVATSFPNFVKTAKQAGLAITDVRDSRRDIM